MKRRSFFEKLGIGAAVVAIAPDLKIEPTNVKTFVAESNDIMYTGDSVAGSLLNIGYKKMDDFDIRIWAGSSYENRNQAPFKMLSDGQIITKDRS